MNERSWLVTRYYGALHRRSCSMPKCSTGFPPLWGVTDHGPLALQSRFYCNQHIRGAMVGIAMSGSRPKFDERVTQPEQARTMRQLGWTLEDIGEAMHLSRSRVGQLVKEF